MAEPPARQSLARLANGHDHPVQRDLAECSQRPLGLEREAAAEPAGPGRLLLTADREQAAVEFVGKQAHRLRSALALGHQGEVVAIEVIAELGMVDLLAGKQALDALAAPLRTAAWPALGLTHVLLAYGFEQAVEQRGLPAQQAAQDGGRDFGPLGLFDQEVAE